MTKGELASKILKLLGVNTRLSEASPEEVQDTLGYLEDWMLANSAMGRRLGYIKSDVEPNPEDESGVPDWAVMGITSSVAIMIAPYFEKQVHPSLVKLASQGMSAITSRTVEVQDVQYPSRFPRGHAQGTPFGPKFYHPADRIRTNNDFLSDEGDEPITG